MSMHNGTLDKDTRMTFGREPTQAGFVDEERILDADEIAAELVPDALAEPNRAQRPPLPRPSAGAFGTFGTFEFSAANTQRPSAPKPQKRQAVEPSHELQALRLELARAQSRMRARDAYLVELERALDESSRQLAAAGLASVEDAYALLGRVRGQAFRIAELESELRQTRLALSRAQESLRAQAPAPSHGKPALRAARPEPSLVAE